MSTNVYNKLESEAVAVVFKQTKQLFHYADAINSFGGRSDWACTVTEKDNVISKIATLGWYVSRGFFIKCPKGFTYMVVDVHGHANQIYFMFLEKVS